MTRAQKARFWLVGVAVTGASLYILADVLLPFVAGMAIAYLLDPVADRLERLGASRIWATIFVTLGIVLVMLIVAPILIGLLVDQMRTLIANMPAYHAALTSWLEGIIGDIEAALTDADMARLRTAASHSIGTGVGWIAGLLRSAISGGAWLLEALSLLFITPVVAFYMLRDWDVMVAQIDEWLPRAHAPVIREQVRAIDEILSGFIRGQMTVCLVLGTFYGVGLTLVGLEVGLIVGLGAGLISFVPYVGAIVGFVLSVGLALAQFNLETDLTRIILTGVIFIIGQVAEGNFLTPKLVGDRIGLHPVWVIFALLAGGALFGFLGLMIAVPAAAVIGVLVRFGLRNYLNSPLYLSPVPVDVDGHPVGRNVPHGQGHRPQGAEAGTGTET